MANIRIRLLAGTALALAGASGANAALADTTLGWYVAAEAGQNFKSVQSLDISDVTLTSTPASASAAAPLGSNTSLKTDYSAAGFMRAGYQFTPNLRAEIELGARAAKITDGLAAEATPNLGSVDKTSAMVNLIYDIKPDWAIHPFVGVGAGVVHAKTDYKGPSTLNGHARNYVVNTQSTVPAAQVLAGASWYVTERLKFDMTYRYLRTGNAQQAVTATDTHTPPSATVAVTDAYSAKSSGHFSDHSLTVGLRWMFGAITRRARPAEVMSAPEPAPVIRPAAVQSSPVATAPIPAPVAVSTTATEAQDSGTQGAETQPPSAAQVQPPVMTIPEARRFTVYFASASARLNATAQSVVVSAAQYAKAAHSPKVAVVGHADTLGSAAYNMALSQRRAKAVAGGLKAQGVPASAISIRWTGERDLAVPTRNGVSRAENRRTTIDVRF